ncbi:8-amino-3,8-dideoxy-manno-octulosonate cytidylyltransferase [compost metagenome]
MVINGYCEIKEEISFRNPSIPKVVMRPDESLLYMSRAAIPTSKDLKFQKAWRQVCAYAFPRSALLQFALQNSKTPIEEIEDIEILRFLELGHRVQMVKLSSQSVAVDTEEDIQRAEDAIRKLCL